VAKITSVVWRGGTPFPHYNALGQAVEKALASPWRGVACAERAVTSPRARHMPGVLRHHQRGGKISGRARAARVWWYSRISRRVDRGRRIANAAPLLQRSRPVKDAQVELITLINSDAAVLANE